MDYTVLGDEDLIRLCIHSRPEALSELYDRYGRLVFSLVLNLVGDRYSAEEITQDVFFRVWEKAGTYQAEQAKVSTWITSIARNRAIDDLRKQNVRPEGHSVGWDDLAAGITPIASDLEPEDAAEKSIQAKRIQLAIASLPLDQQKALALAYFRGYTHSQIAAELNEPLGTVKTRIRMAMQKLRSVLEEQTEPG